MDRKEFIKTCGAFCVGSIAAMTVLQSCNMNYYATTTNSSNNLVTIKKSEFIDAKHDNKIRPYVLVNVTTLSFPVCIYRLNENVYSALLMECTHNSCELNPQGSFLVCPCHGSEFSNVGKVQNPPAEIDLKSFKITHDEENIHLHLT